MGHWGTHVWVVQGSRGSSYIVSQWYNVWIKYSDGTGVVQYRWVRGKFFFFSLISPVQPACPLALPGNQSTCLILSLCHCHRSTPGPSSWLLCTANVICLQVMFLCLLRLGYSLQNYYRSYSLGLSQSRCPALLGTLLIACDPNNNLIFILTPSPLPLSGHHTACHCPPFIWPLSHLVWVSLEWSLTQLLGAQGLSDSTED